MEAEALQPSDELTFDSHFTFIIHLGHKSLLLFQPPKQDTGPPVDKSLCQRIVKRIRQAVFYSACLVPPMVFVT